jgi:hypothetical protein
LQFIHQRHALGAGVRCGEPVDKQGLPNGFGFVDGTELALIRASAVKPTEYSKKDLKRSTSHHDAAMPDRLSGVSR